MNILDWLFRRNRIGCPRCQGKGHVDQEDITRLKMELYWQPGKCAYCNGTGKVSPGRLEKIKPDEAYLTLDLPFWEKSKLKKGDMAALERADEYKAIVHKMVAQIEQMYFVEQLTPDQIVRQLLQENGDAWFSESGKKELVAYIEKIVKSRR